MLDTNWTDPKAARSDCKRGRERENVSIEKNKLEKKHRDINIQE